MSLQKNINYQITESIQVQQLVLQELGEVVELAALQIVNVLLADKKILSCGDAASVANAQYFVSLMINRYQRVRPSLPAISLVNDVQMITSIANSQYHDDIYARQLRALGQASDILLIYSVDEGALSLVKLISAAHEKSLQVILLSGENDLTLHGMLHDADVCVTVPSQLPHRIQEAHLLLSHCLCDLVDSQIFGNQLI